MKILVVLPRFPYPLEKGDKLRAYHQIRILSKRHEIYLFCVSHEKVGEEQIEALRPYCREIEIVFPSKIVSYKNVLRNYLWAKSLQIGYWDSQKARRAYKAFETKVHPDVIYNQMVRTMTLVSRSTLPKVMDFQDALSMNTERRMDNTRAGLWHHILHFEFKMLRSSEYNSFNIFDALTIISEIDSEAIPHKKNGEIKIVPNGVDFDYFNPIDCEKKYDILFCGNMQYPPNVDAAKFLVEDILPIVKQQIPSAKVLIAGASPKSGVRNLASDDVTVTGWVDDIRQCYAQSRIFVAPMRIGSGLQNKLLEAMAMQLPCVTTTIANDSLQAENGKEILIGNDAQTIAQHIVTLLQNQEISATMAQDGNNYVRRNFDWDSAVGKLEQILTKVAGK